MSKVSEITLPAFKLDASGIHPYPAEPGDLVYLSGDAYVIVRIVSKWSAEVRPARWYEHPLQRFCNWLRD